MFKQMKSEVNCWVAQGWRSGISFGSEPKRILKTFGYLELSLSTARILKGGHFPFSESLNFATQYNGWNLVWCRQCTVRRQPGFQFSSAVSGWCLLVWMLWLHEQPMWEGDLLRRLMNHSYYICREEAQCFKISSLWLPVIRAPAVSIAFKTIIIMIVYSML